MTYHRRRCTALPELAKDDLLADLSADHAVGITVVTPNRRLAQALGETSDILPYAGFVERCYEDALYSDLAPDTRCPKSRSAHSLC